MCATAPFVAVIGGDLQHDETLLPRMLDALEGDDALDVVIGSRFVDGGGTGEVGRGGWRSRRWRRSCRGACSKADLSDR